VSAKNLLIKPIDAGTANRFVKKMHYSQKVVPNSQLHLGVFFAGQLEGVMQFGPSLNKKGSINLVSETAWNGFIELNRMAFSEALPKNSESRAISVAMRFLKKYAPQIEWVMSFADATQCGDGTIYRASGFVLTAIRPNEGLRQNPQTGETLHAISAYHQKKIKRISRLAAFNWLPVKICLFSQPCSQKKIECPNTAFFRNCQTRCNHVSWVTP
jgi:hypothetical protein